MFSDFKIYYLAVCFSGLLFSGCNKLVEVSAPANSVGESAAFSTDANAIGVMTGVYVSMAGDVWGNSSSPNVSAPCYTGLSSDELAVIPAAYVSQDHGPFYQNQVLANGSAVSDLWASSYKYIYAANAVVEGVSGSTGISAGVKQQLLGEAKFIRAYCYFFLVNCFGDVPLTLSTDYVSNGKLARSAKEDVYQQIIADLTDASAQMSDHFLAGDLVSETDERVRPTRFAAEALLSRVYLYHQQYELAEQAAGVVIDQQALFDTVSLNNAFLINNKEAIWQLQAVNTWLDTWEAYTLVIPSTGLSDYSHPYYLNPSLVDSFETGDLRKAKWIGKFTDNSQTPAVDYYYAYKYKFITLNEDPVEYVTPLRLSEQYLIRAEARARQGKTADAATDLNLIRHKAGLGNTTASSAEQLVGAVLHERQTELFLEGHRWFDLRRSGNIDAVMDIACPLKGSEWRSFQQWYPVPTGEIAKDRALTQNQGY